MVQWCLAPALMSCGLPFHQSTKYPEDWMAWETGQILQAGDQASVCVINMLAFADVSFIFLMGIMFLKAFLSTFRSLPYAGMKFMEDRPIQSLVPLYLLVGGITRALKVKVYGSVVCSFYWNLAYRHHGVQPLTHSSILAWRIPWTEEPGELLSIGSHKS